MGFDRRAVTLALPTGATYTTTINLRSEYIRPLSFTATLTGGDNATKVRLTDKDNRIFYLDAADADYTTVKYRQLGVDDTATGLGPDAFDSVGVAVTGAQTAPMPVVRSPIELALVNSGSAGSLAFSLDYEFGCFYGQGFVVPKAAATETSSVTIQLRGKYAQILGFRALSVGTSTTSRLQIKDVDGKIVYLDAADKNYDAAELDKIIILDDTATNLTKTVPFDATGAAAGAAGVFQPPLVRSPITITQTAAEGADEVVTGVVYYKTG